MNINLTNDGMPLQFLLISTVFDTARNTISRIIDERSVFRVLWHPQSIFSVDRRVRYPPVFPVCLFLLSDGWFLVASPEDPKYISRYTNMVHRSSHSSEHTSLSGMSYQSSPTFFPHLQGSIVPMLYFLLKRRMSLHGMYDRTSRLEICLSSKQ